MAELFEAILEEGDIYVKIFSVSIAIVFIIADWKIHTKAGKKGWIALIPIYNVYSFYKIIWKGSAFWYGFLISIPMLIITEMTKQAHNVNIIASVILIILIVLNFIYIIYTNYKTAKAFGHGFGFTIGLTFLYDIFILIISFGKSRYVKNELR